MRGSCPSSVEQRPEVGQHLTVRVLQNQLRIECSCIVYGVFDTFIITLKSMYHINCLRIVSAETAATPNVTRIFRIGLAIASAEWACL